MFFHLNLELLIFLPTDVRIIIYLTTYNSVLFCVVENWLIVGKGHGLRANETAASPVGAEVTSAYIYPYLLPFVGVEGRRSCIWHK
jgi:hypothetical protein